MASDDSDNDNYDEEQEEEELMDEEEEEEEEEDYRKKRSSKSSLKGSSSRKKSKRSSYDEEDEEEEEEDDEEDGRGRNKHRGANPFVDEMADVDDDDEEEEEEGDMEGFLDDEGEDLGELPADSRPRLRPPSMVEDDGFEDEEAIMNMINERYRTADEAELEEGGDQQALLPSVRDPKLWLVRCKQGHEREAVICLMQKFVNKDETEERLLIKSAVALDHLKGYIYVEAEKEAYVRAACRGLRMIYYKISLVEIREMTDVLSVEKKSVEMDVGTWVRVKIGVYKGDLGQIEEVDHLRHQATVKLIPRVDLQAIKAQMDDPDEVKRKKGRPMPRFVNLTELENLHIPLEHKRDPVTGAMFYSFDGKRFMNGYHYKAMSLKSIDAKNVTPSFDEVSKFQKPPESGEAQDDLITNMPKNLGMKQRGQFIKGDVVQVVEGDLKRLIGVVEKVDDDMVTVRPRHATLKQVVEFRAQELRKFYKIGDHVKVVTGQQEGVTGMVIKVDEGVVDVLTDVTKENIRVFVRDVVLSSEVTLGLTRIGDYELHDLVQLDASTVGMIIKVETDGCVVLKGNPDRSEVGVYKVRDIRHKIFDRRFTAQDQQGSAIAINDVVRAVRGKFEKTQGNVEHLSQGLLFIHDKQRMENQGYLCLRASDCCLLGGKSRAGGMLPPHMSRSGAFNNHRDNFFPKSPGHFLQSPSPHHRNNNMHRGGGRGHHNDMVGKTVKIRKGPYKGYQGRITEITDILVRVELDSQMKNISVTRADLNLDNVAESPRLPPRFTPRMGTPMHHSGSRTPMHPSYMSTPMRDSNPTPIGMRTPMRDSAWNPTMTPMRDSNFEDSNTDWNTSTNYEPDAPYSPGGRDLQAASPATRPYDSTTPNMSGWGNVPTPAYNSKTPLADTPGATASTPGAGGAYGLPNTPGGGQPLTPGGAQGAYPGTPGAQPMTPGAGGFGQPMTPGAGFDPTSPAIPAAEGGGYHEVGWAQPEVAVKLRRQTGPAVVGSIMEALPDGTYRVGYSEDGDMQEAIAQHFELDPVVPSRGEEVKILSGEHRGVLCKLVGVDGTDGIVSIDGMIKILDLAILGKRLVVS